MSATRVPKNSFPLQGKRVILTQSLDQCEKLERLLNIEQAFAIKLPTIDFKLVNNLDPIRQAIRTLDQYDILVFTSQNSFEFFHRLMKEEKISKIPEKLKIAVVGDETKLAVENDGFHVTFIPENRKTSDELADYLVEKASLKKKKILFPKSSLSISKLPEKLKASGAWVDDIVLYETSTNADAQLVFNSVFGHSIDWILFSSPSAVRSFFSFSDFADIQAWIFDMGIKIGSIGSTTTKALIEHHIPVSLESPRPSSKILIQSIKEFENYEQF